MGAHPVAVISYELWERGFDANVGTVSALDNWH
jgi:hypothetical protein